MSSSSALNKSFNKRLSSQRSIMHCANYLVSKSDITRSLLHYISQSKFAWTNFITVFVLLIACVIINGLLPDSLNAKKTNRPIRCGPPSDA